MTECTHKHPIPKYCQYCRIEELESRPEYPAQEIADYQRRIEELEQIIGVVGGKTSGQDWTPELMAKRIEELKDELDSYRGSFNAAFKDVAKLEKENDRLREALERILACDCANPKLTTAANLQRIARVALEQNDDT